MKDERTGQSHNYRNRKGIVHALVLLPPNAPKAYADRLTLWNAAESAEKKKNSRVAREVIRERKAEIHKSNDSNFSGKFNHPTKIIAEDEVIQKVRTEAKAARAKVPPDMRAEPYGNETSKNLKPESGFSKGFETAGQTTAEEKAPKMSSSFNGASKANATPEEPNPHKPSFRA